MKQSPSIRIWHETLPPLSELSPDDHIHGGLRLQIGGRLVPHLGFFSPDDVCFNTWLEELWAVAEAFESSPDTRHIFDEGEQGQPAFVFDRDGESAYFSITDSEFSEGEANPDWQRIEFLPPISSPCTLVFGSHFSPRSEPRHPTAPSNGFADMIQRARTPHAQDGMYPESEFGDA